MREQRLLEPKNIPPSLWSQDDEALVFPASRRSVYAGIIEELNLTSLVSFADHQGAIGGISKDETDQHFAQAFSGSVARVLLAVLDPKDEVGDASDAFLRCTTGTSVCITDAPCGSGAAAAAFLCAIAELRAEQVIPREPLNAKLIGAELSPAAREYAEMVMKRISAFLEEQAIFLTWEFRPWDVTCDLSTADLVRTCVLGSATAENKLLMIANFSGFLGLSGKRKDSEKQLRELFRYASADKSFAVWIEPNMNKVLDDGGLFPWLRQSVLGGWRRFAKFLGKWKRKSTGDGDDPVALSQAKFRHPLDQNHLANVRLAVIAIALERS